MPYHEKRAIFSNSGTRNEVRTRVLEEFWKEEPELAKEMPQRTTPMM